MKRKNQLWTFEYPNGDRAQLDYILVRKKWQNSVRDSRSYSSFSSVSSDHRIVSASVKLSLRASKKAIADPMKAIDWKKVSSDPELSSEYSINVFNRFQQLSEECASDLNDIETIYSNIAKANEEIALTSLPKKPKSKHKPIHSAPNVIDARSNLKHISSIYHAHPSRVNKNKLAAAKKSIDEAYLHAEVAYINGKIADISNLHISRQH